MTLRVDFTGSWNAKVKPFYDDLVGTGHELGVAMAVMEDYAAEIRSLAVTETKNAMRTIS